MRSETNAYIRNYVVAFSLLLLVTMFAVEPSLAQERANPRDAGTDDSRAATGLLFLLTLGIAGLSVGHCRTVFNAPTPIRHLALATFLLSGAFQTWAMILRSVGTEFKVMQELLRHSTLRSTLDVYTQAITPAKHAAQAALLSLVFSQEASRTSQLSSSDAAG
jgi:hypothetical protein